MDAAKRASRVRLMGFDVDGVLTDGSLYFTPGGDEIKAFSSLDGHGLRMLAAAGVEIAIISGRTSRALELRAANLDIGELYMGVSDKRACMLGLLSRHGLEPAAAGYMGDDVVDLPVLRCCGFSAAPADAHQFVRAHVALVTGRPGGRGAVREACDFILQAQGRLDAMLASYLD